MTRFTVVVNNGYSVQDSPEPEAWVQPILASGVRHIDYFVDHLEPVICENVIRNRSGYYAATMEAIRRHELTVVSATTGRISYLLNVLAHPYDDMRDEGIRWCKRMVDLAAALGAPFATGHFDYISKTDLRERPAQAEQRALDGLLLMAEYAAERALEGLALEQMHGPQLRPYTVEQAQRFLAWLNQRSAVPIYLLVDTGHMAHVDPGDANHTEKDKDPYHWLSQKYAGLDKVFVHLQQTDNSGSRHWPFTETWNRCGIISPERVIESIERSGVAEAYLSFEILYPRGQETQPIAEGIQQSVRMFVDAFGRAGYARHGDTFERETCQQGRHVGCVHLGKEG